VFLGYEVHMGSHISYFWISCASILHVECITDMESYVLHIAVHLAFSITNGELSRREALLDICGVWSSCDIVSQFHSYLSGSICGHLSSVAFSCISGSICGHHVPFRLNKFHIYELDYISGYSSVRNTSSTRRYRST